MKIYNFSKPAGIKINNKSDNQDLLQYLDFQLNASYLDYSQVSH